MKLNSFLIAGTLLAASCKPKQVLPAYIRDSKTPTEIRAIENKRDKVLEMFVGHFSNKNAVARKEIDIAQEVIIRRLWPERVGEHWFYLAWFPADQTQRPLAYAVFNLRQHSPDTMLVEMFGFEKPDQYYELWKSEQPLKGVSPKQLVPYGEPGKPCASYIVQRETDKFEMFSNGCYCYQVMSDALHFYQLELFLTPEQIDFRTKFFSPKKELIIHFKDGNRFDRLDKNQPKYPESK